MTREELIEVDPEKMGGTPVFFGTRVPIQNFFDYLEGGDGPDIFLDQFPTVEHEQVMTLIRLMREAMLADYDEPTDEVAA